MAPDSRHVILIGLSGVGKSSVARGVASRLRCGYADTDDLAAEIDGDPPPVIIRKRGLAAFREIETAALRQALSNPAATVIATGGGIVETPDNRTLLAREQVVWLDASPEAIAARIAASRQDRPLLDGDPVAQLTALYATRAPWYESLADTRIPTEGRSARDVVSAVVAALEEI